MKNVYCTSRAIIVIHLQFISSDCRVLSVVTIDAVEKGHNEVICHLEPSFGKPPTLKKKHLMFQAFPLPV